MMGVVVVATWVVVVGAEEAKVGRLKEGQDRMRLGASLFMG